MILDMRITLEDSEELKPFENKELDQAVADNRKFVLNNIKENNEYWLKEWDFFSYIHLTENNRFFYYTVRIGFSSLGRQSPPTILRETTIEYTMDDWLDLYIDSPPTFEV